MIINDIEPYNDIMLKNCFYNSLFSVLRFYQKDTTKLLMNEVGYLELNNEYLIYETEDVLEINTMLNDIGLKFIESTDENINNFIISFIDKRCPIIVNVDCFYLKIRQDTYKKTHCVHSITIYGYDSYREKYMIIEHDYQNSTRFKKREIDFLELKNAYLMNEDRIIRAVVPNGQNLNLYKKELLEEIFLEKIKKVNTVKNHSAVSFLIKYVNSFQKIKNNEDFKKINKNLIDINILAISHYINFLLTLLKIELDENKRQSYQELYNNWIMFRGCMVKLKYSFKFYNKDFFNHLLSYLNSCSEIYKYLCLN